MKPETTEYRGERADPSEGTTSPVTIWVDGVELDIEPSRELREHSIEFNWGYGGSGPAQTALAVLLDFTGDPDMAQRHYQAFKFEKVGAWDSEWNLSGRDLARFLRKQAKKGR